mgnify:CR=1 FL=1
MAKKLSSSTLIQLVLNSFEAERTNNIEDGLALIHPDFTKTSMLKSDGVVFPVLESKRVRQAVTVAYKVEGREFYIFNTAANEDSQTVFIELAEREPRVSGDVLWPYVLVCVIEDGKILRTRHYGDPSLLQEVVTIDQIKEVVE